MKNSDYVVINAAMPPSHTATIATTLVSDATSNKTSVPTPTPLDGVTKRASSDNMKKASSTSTKPPTTASLQVKTEWLTNVKNLKLPKHLNADNFTELVNTLLKFSDVFYDESIKVGTFYKNVNITTNGKSRSRPQYRIPEATFKDFQNEINRLEHDGVIEICTDNKGFCSPTFAVPKRSGKLRIVTDFSQTLNKVIKDPDPFPVGNIEEVFSNIRPNAKFLGTFDLHRGYHQLVIEPCDRHKTAFYFNGQMYQYVRVPMGMTHSGNLFSRAVMDALHSMTDLTNIQLYVDDALLHASNFREYMKTLENFFKSLDNFGLKLNPEKCTILATEVLFLGRIVNSRGYSANPDYVKDILMMPSPTSRKELQRLIGSMVWRRHFWEPRGGEHIKACTFAQIAATLHELNRANQKFEWTPAAEAAFSKLKKRLTSSPIIAFPDFTKKFILACDASEIAAGYVLLQRINDRNVIIAAGSKTFDSTQRNWSTVEKEAFGVKYGIAKNDYFLRSRSFLVLSDHRSLCLLDQKFFKNAKLQRWQNEICSYSFAVQYISGQNNVFADLLSRPNGTHFPKPQHDPEPAGQFYEIEHSKLFLYVPSWAHIENPKLNAIENVDSKVVKAFFSTLEDGFVTQMVEHSSLALEQRKDNFLKKIIDGLEDEKHGKSIELNSIFNEEDHRTSVYRRNWINLHLEKGTDVLILTKNGQNLPIIPYSLRPQLLYSAHNAMNHSGIHRMREHLNCVTWIGKDADIIHYASSCVLCAKRKGRYGQLQDWTSGHVKRGTKPFSVVYLDFVTMPQSKGKRYILTILCSYSRFFICIPMARDRAIDAARGLYKLFLDHREIPRQVSSDRGTHFTGIVYKEFCNLMNIRQDLHVPWHPESTGNLERQHRTLKNSLFILCNERKEEWTDLLQSVVSNMNCCANKSTKISPHFLVTGRKPNIFIPSSGEEISGNTSPTSYAQKVKSLLLQASKTVNFVNNEADFKVDKQLNKNTVISKLEAGDTVFLYRPQSEEAKRTKLPWLGPYSVLKTNNMVAKIQRENATEWVHRKHLRRLQERNEELQVPIFPPHMSQTPVVTPPLLCSHVPPSGEPIQVDPIDPAVDAVPVEQGRPKRSNAGVPPNRLINTMDAKKKSYFCQNNNFQEDELEDSIFNFIPIPSLMNFSSLNQFNTMESYVSKNIEEIVTDSDDSENSGSQEEVIEGSENFVSFDETKSDGNLNNSFDEYNEESVVEAVAKIAQQKLDEELEKKPEEQVDKPPVPPRPDKFISKNEKRRGTIQSMEYFLPYSNFHIPKNGKNITIFESLPKTKVILPEALQKLPMKTMLSNEEKQLCMYHAETQQTYSLRDICERNIFMKITSIFTLHSNSKFFLNTTFEEFVADRWQYAEMVLRKIPGKLYDGITKDAQGYLWPFVVLKQSKLSSKIEEIMKKKKSTSYDGHHFYDIRSLIYSEIIYLFYIHNLKLKRADIEDYESLITLVAKQAVSDDPRNPTSRRLWINDKLFLLYTENDTYI